MIINKRTLKRIRNLGNICDFDMENAVATLKLHFRDLSELIDDKISTEDNLIIRQEILAMIEEDMNIVPKEFRVNYRILVHDYHGYDPETVQNAFEKAKETYSFRRKATNNDKLSRMTAFFLIGFILLVPLILNNKYRWFASSTRMVSVGIAFFLELVFELFFEDGIGYFTVGRIYDNFSKKNRSRIGTIKIEKAP